MPFRAPPKSYADSSPCFLVATCCQTHSQVYADRFQKFAAWNRWPTVLFWIDAAAIFLGGVFLLVFLFCLLAFVASVVFMAFCGVCWLLVCFWILVLLAFVGFCLLLDLVSLRYWLLVWLLRFGFSWLLLFWLRLAFVPDTPFCWNYMYFCRLHITLHRHI